MKTKLLTALFLTFAAPALAGEKVEMFRAAGASAARNTPITCAPAATT